MTAIIITNISQLDGQYTYDVINTPDEAAAIAEFSKRYTWIAGQTPDYQLRHDFYFRVEWKNNFDKKRTQC